MEAPCRGLGTAPTGSSFCGKQYHIILEIERILWDFELMLFSIGIDSLPRHRGDREAG